MAVLTYEEAAHCLRRMGFGGSPDEINELVPLGREATVAHLLDYEQINNKPLEKFLKKNFKSIRKREGFVVVSVGSLQTWWLARLLLTRRQLEEKMTLFWHGLFATEAMAGTTLYGYAQNLTFRANALERFDTIVLAIARDPGMIVYLNTNENVKEHPNENYARELMELHTMGVTDVVTGEANYSQKDVEEVARAFTGWNLRNIDVGNATFVFDETRHDFGLKSIFGRAPTNLNGEDVVTIICERPATARYISKRLFEFFAYPLTDSPEDTATIEKLAAVYFEKNHSIRELLRSIFMSDEFFSERARFALRKSPIEFVVGAIRMFGAVVNLTNRSDSEPMSRANRMGQSLFSPPGVNGWPPDEWFGTGSMLERLNYATHFATTRTVPTFAIDAIIPLAQLQALTASSAGETADAVLRVAGPLPVSDEIRQELIEFLTRVDDQRVEFTPSPAIIDRKVRSLAALVMMLPQFQLS